jgi:hypothetical protein
MAAVRRVQFFLGMGFAGGAAVLASWSIYDHQVYLVPVDCFTFAMGLFAMVRSSQ